MAAEGTKDGGAGMNKGQGKYFNHEKRSGGGTRFARTDQTGAPRTERTGSSRTERTGSSRTERTGSSRADRPADRNRQKNEYAKKSYGQAPRFPKKDEEEEDRGRRSKPMHARDNKPSVSVPDKDKALLRLEKEQKSVRKKQNNKKRESSRPQPRQKRSNNINYTKNYANGAYDDYEDFDDWEE